MGTEQRPSLITSLIEEYKKDPTSPELVTSLFQQIWKERQQKLKEVGGVDVDLAVPPCPYTQAELVALNAEGRRVAYLPQALSTQKDRHLLVLIWPEMRDCSTQPENNFPNGADRSGWFDCERSWYSPYAGLQLNMIEKAITSRGKYGMNLNEYIVAAEDNKLFIGTFFDEDGESWSWLLDGTRDKNDGGIIASVWSKKGLHVQSVLDVWKKIGGRSVGLPHQSS